MWKESHEKMAINSPIMLAELLVLKIMRKKDYLIFFTSWFVLLYGYVGQYLPKSENMYFKCTSKGNIFSIN